MTEAPARILGLDAGRLAKGAPADLVLFDPEAPWKITEAEPARACPRTRPSRAAWSRAGSSRTLVDGRTIYRAGD